MNARAKIIVILGSNSLGILTVSLTIVVITFMAYRFLIIPILGLRITKEHEIIGQDTTRHISILNNTKLRIKNGSVSDNKYCPDWRLNKDSYDVKLENHISDLVNHFYPENIQDFLRKKE